MKKKQEPKAPAVIGTYETEIEFNCPLRGKVKQKVLVKRFETAEAANTPDEVLPSKSLAEKLDRKFSGILISDNSLEEEPQENSDVDPVH